MLLEAAAAALIRVGLIDRISVGLMVTVVLFGGLNCFGMSGSIIDGSSKFHRLLGPDLLPQCEWGIRGRPRKELQLGTWNTSTVLQIKKKEKKKGLQLWPIYQKSFKIQMMYIFGHDIFKSHRFAA